MQAIASSDCVKTQLDRTTAAILDGHFAYRAARTRARSAASVVSAWPPVSFHDFFSNTRWLQAFRIDWPYSRWNDVFI